MTYRVSEAGLANIRVEEGLKLVAYPDPESPRARTGVGSGDPWTIGVGHTGPEVREGLRWTEEQVMDALRRDVRACENSINRSVKTKLNQNQVDALGSFIFNVGVGAFESSTMLKRINEGRFALAAEEFPRWCIPSSLIPRRSRERARFLGMPLVTYPVVTPEAYTTDVQKKLGVAADGVYGPQTRAAVIAFQKAHGLDPDGIVGPRTLKALGL